MASRGGCHGGGGRGRGAVVEVAAEAPETSALLCLRAPISQTSKAPDHTDRVSSSSAAMDPSSATLIRGVEALGI